MSYKECDVNRNAWSKDAEKLDFIQKSIYKCRYEKLSDCCTSPVAKNRRVRASLSAAEIHFLKSVSFFEMNGANIAKRCSNSLGDIQEYLKMKLATLFYKKKLTHFNIFSVVHIYGTLQFMEQYITKQL